VTAKAKPTPGKGPRVAVADKRRKRIFAALHDCVIEWGYAKTSLTDVARAADMSPSHLLYYFPGKDAILVQYFAHFKRRIMERLDQFRTTAPEGQINLLARLFFAGRGISKSEIGFMLECFGVAVHEKELQKEKMELDQFCKAYLCELFEKSPCGPSNASSAAEVAYAMLVGLRTAAYFDDRLGPEKALEIFRNEVLRIANQQPGGRPVPPRSSVADNRNRCDGEVDADVARL
jgi:AcrR family transcriptional regulator